MNRSLEFHDSTLFSIEDADGMIRILLSPAIINASEGEPGVDVGTVWLQDVEIQFVTLGPSMGNAVIQGRAVVIKTIGDPQYLEEFRST